MILDEQYLNREIPTEKLPTEIHLVVYLTMYVETADKSGLVIYDYARDRKNWFPFFDDRHNEVMTCKVAAGETFKQVLDKSAALSDEKLSGRVNLAKMRFTEKFGTQVEVKPFVRSSKVIEHKYVPDQQTWVLNVYYFFVITEISNTSKILTPQSMQAKIVAPESNLSDIDGMPLVEYMIDAYRYNLQQLREHKIKIGQK